MQLGVCRRDEEGDGFALMARRFTSPRRCAGNSRGVHIRELMSVRLKGRLEWENEERRRGQEHLNAILDQSGQILGVELHDLACDSQPVVQRANAQAGPKRKLYRTDPHQHQTQCWLHHGRSRLESWA